jgi:hypothetical protein
MGAPFPYAAPMSIVGCRSLSMSRSAPPLDEVIGRRSLSTSRSALVVLLGDGRPCEDATTEGERRPRLRAVTPSTRAP